VTVVAAAGEPAERSRGLSDEPLVPGAPAASLYDAVGDRHTNRGPYPRVAAAAAAAVAAGVIFIGVQVNHPHLDAATITTTEMAIRSSLKVLMAGLALVGITGMYLRQVKETGVLGLVGYLAFAAGWLLILGTSFAGAFVLPAIADTNAGYVNDAITVVNGGTPDGDIGPWASVILLQVVSYLAGGLLFGIALYRARVLVRWGAALLAVSGLVTVTLSVMPDALYRLLAWPNGITMVALGYSLWQSTCASTPASDATPAPRLTTAGAA
jgi:hypothetical protein